VRHGIMTTASTRQRIPRLATGLAAVWGVGLVVAAPTLPVYGSGATLVEVNGAGVLWVVTVPLVAALVVAGCLATGGRTVRGMAWAVTSLVAMLGLLALLTIGIAIVPVAVALAVALIASRPQSGAMPRGWGPPGQH
jgi:hypothetical protein